ncbi:polycystin-2 [Drosophila ananassae]|uniref:polycystin-2 n=1 Tax=Drosophila ananassae TaxID=7217 RepID=UPI000177CA50|nr:polycystin-2 [Drosophila ananassae]
MVQAKESNIIFFMTFFIMAGCAFCIWKFSGFSHEPVKVNKMMIVFISVCLVQIVIVVPIKFAIISLDAALWPPHQATISTDSIARVETLMGNLRRKLQSLKSQLMITERHRYERLNLKYRLITEELRVFGRLFFILLIFVLVIFDNLLYYNNKITQDLFQHNHTGTVGLSTVFLLPNIYLFLESSIIRAFTERGDFGGAPWVHAESTKMLGSVRLRQLRTVDRHVGLQDPVFDVRDYSEGWKLPYAREAYTDKFWKIHQPWVMRESTVSEHILFRINHYGHFISYPESIGYQNLLSDSRKKSLIILRYLKRKSWLDRNTSALFIDFTLYNADGNVFSVCTLWLEQFPFGSSVTHMTVDSVVFVERMRDFSSFGMLVLFIFLICWLQFAKLFFAKVWYEPGRLRNIWTKLDAITLTFSVLLVGAMARRDKLVQQMIRDLETSVNVEFIDFQRPLRFNDACNVFMGFTVALITLRLWRVMQFARTFQLFNKTLRMAGGTLVSTFIVTAVFLMSIGTSAVVTNGNFSPTVNNLKTGIISVASFSFGYSIALRDFLRGGKWLGIVLYAVLGFVVKALLLNMIMSMLERHLADAKAQRDRKNIHRITYWEFLRVEYADAIKFIMKLFHRKRGYRRNNRTVAQNIQRKLYNQERIGPKAKRRKNFSFTFESREPVDQKFLQLLYRERIEKTFVVFAILKTQIELLERLKFGDEEGNLSESEEENISEEEMDPEPDPEPPPPPPPPPPPWHHGIVINR